LFDSLQRYGAVGEINVFQSVAALTEVFAGFVCDRATGGKVEVQQVRTVFTETLTTAVGDSDTLGENQLLHVRAVQTKLFEGGVTHSLTISQTKGPQKASTPFRHLFYHIPLDCHLKLKEINSLPV
jgi:hypothetical protein